VTGSDLPRRVAGTYATLAGAWDTGGAAWNLPVAARLAGLAGLAPGMRVLDVGCGAGAVSIPAARAVSPGGQVTGIDIAGPMLGRARRAARAAGLTSIVFENGDATAPPFPPASFDAVLASMVVYLLADPGATLASWRDLLRPGGIVAFTWVIAEDPKWEPVFAAVDGFLPDGQEGWGTFWRRHQWNSVTQVEALLDGYREVSTVAEPVTTRYGSPGHWWESSWTQAPALIWRHIPLGRRGQARDDAFKILEDMRAADGTLARARTVCYTVARLAAAAADGWPGG
jgi:SAM-dependent methyltransferase